MVEFIEGQRFICAVVTGAKGSRYHLLTHLGREVNLPGGRILHASEAILGDGPREDLVRTLKEVCAQRDKLKEAVDIPELWELVRDEGTNSWAPDSLAQLAFSGEVGPDHGAALIRAVIDDHTYFKYRSGRIQVQTPEAVEQLLIQRAREQERLKRLSAGSRWLDSVWQAEVATSSLDKELGPDEEYWVEALKEYCIHGDEARDADAVRALFRQAGMKGDNLPFETLVRAGVWDRDENLELERQGLEVAFSDRAMEQARRLATSAPSIGGDRLDLRGEEIFTIDALESLDLDDAMSISHDEEGRLVLGIHITDIGLQLEPSTPLFEEALGRATTIYMPDSKVPMLPEILSQGAWSLVEGEERRALSFFVTLDATGEVADFSIKRSLIKVSRRLTYHTADQLIEEDPSFSELYHLLRSHEQRRIERGALPLPIPELVIQVQDGGEVNVYLNTPGNARFLVAESMILANYVAAVFLDQSNIPALFRSQPEPRERIISGEERGLLPNLRQRRRISRGTLDTVPMPHNGLGLEVYTTVTSPLRRGLDLLMQQQLGAFLVHGNGLHSRQALEEALVRLNQGLASAGIARQARTRYWLLKHLLSRKKERLEAWVLEAGPNRVLVILKDYLMPVELPRQPGVDYSLDDTVFLKIKKVSPRENVLKFDWADSEGRRR